MFEKSDTYELIKAEKRLEIVNAAISDWFDDFSPAKPPTPRDFYIMADILCEAEDAVDAARTNLRGGL